MNQPQFRLSRRTLFGGASVAGAVAATATVLPGLVQQTESAPQPKQPPEKGGGYQLTEHVKRYYKSTLV
jgi:hypothetical protein